jgi:hypothetical protein
MQSKANGQTSERKPFSYRHLILTFIACLITLAFIHQLTLTIYHHIWFPSSYDEPRNSFFLRGWEHYTALPESNKNDNPYLVIVISNSQGFLFEESDGTLTYSHQLQVILEETLERSVQVLNWSVPGSNAAEQIILAARAITHQPDAILWITHNTNLVRAQFHPLDFYLSDVPHLAYDPTVRQYLSSQFLTIHDGNDPLDWLTVHTGIGKLLHIFEKKRDRRWSWIPRVHLSTTELYEWNEEADYYLKVFYETVNRGDSQIPVAFVSMPLNADQYSDKEWAEMILFPERVNAIYSTLDNVRVYDATQAIPKNLFYTATHYRPEGHKQFADWLYQHIFTDDRLEP